VKYWSANTELPVNYLLDTSTSFTLDDVNKYATGIGFQDGIIWDYSKNVVKEVLKQTQDLGLIAHIWTFKDDVLLFNSKNNIDMYTIGQKVMNLDGIITEFCDIYAPIAQLLRKQANEEIQENDKKFVSQLKRRE
jgi:glycerophosphoryl diester phosphodiesterase